MRVKLSRPGASDRRSVKHGLEDRPIELARSTGTEPGGRRARKQGDHHERSVPISRAVLGVTRQHDACRSSSRDADDARQDGGETRRRTPRRNPPLATFLTLIQNVRQAQLLVPTRAIGAAAARDAARDLLFTAAEMERLYVQTLVDANQSRAVTLIENAGPRGRALPGPPEAAPGARQRPAARHRPLRRQRRPPPLDGGVPRRSRFRCINWAFSVDGGKTFVSAPATPNGKTTLVGLPSLTIVGRQGRREHREGGRGLEPGGDHPGALTAAATGARRDGGGAARAGGQGMNRGARGSPGSSPPSLGRLGRRSSLAADDAVIGPLLDRVRFGVPPQRRPVPLHGSSTISPSSTKLTSASGCG